MCILVCIDLGLILLSICENLCFLGQFNFWFQFLVFAADVGWILRILLLSFAIHVKHFVFDYGTVILWCLPTFFFYSSLNNTIHIFELKKWKKRPQHIVFFWFIKRYKTYCCLGITNDTKIFFILHAKIPSIDFYHIVPR